MSTKTEFAMLARLLQIQGDHLSSEGARFVLNMHFNDSDHERVSVLGEKANNSELTFDKRAEYERYIRVGDLLSILKLKARILLKSLGQAGHGLP